jgi:hypothetical protein
MTATPQQPLSEPDKDTDASTMRPAEREAHQLLMAAWRPGEHGFEVPVDPFYIARRLGLRVFAADLDPDVSGMLGRGPTAPPQSSTANGYANFSRSTTWA